MEVDGVTTRQSKAGTLSTSVISFAIIIHPYVMMMMMMMMMMMIDDDDDDDDRLYMVV